MFAHRLHRRCIALLAVLAVVFGALAPTVARALVAERGQDAIMQVCTGSGMLMLQADADIGTAGDSGTAPDLQQHCPWCNVAHAPAAWPTTELTLPLLPCAQEMPVAFYRAGPTPAVWRGALTRAPPALRG